MSKKYGGIITGWQLHIISQDIKEIKELMPSIEFYVPKTMAMTGTVVDDPTGRWLPGYHIRTSFIVRINGDVIETKNTRYHVIGPEGDPVVGFKDLGPAVMGIFY